MVTCTPEASRNKHTDMTLWIDIFCSLEHMPMEFFLHGNTCSPQFFSGDFKAIEDNEHQDLKWLCLFALGSISSAGIVKTAQ